VDWGCFPPPPFLGERWPGPAKFLRLGIATTYSSIVNAHLRKAPWFCVIPALSCFFSSWSTFSHRCFGDVFSCEGMFFPDLSPFLGRPPLSLLPQRCFSPEEESRGPLFVFSPASLGSFLTSSVIFISPVFPPFDYAVPRPVFPCPA